MALIKDENRLNLREITDIVNSSKKIFDDVMIVDPITYDLYEIGMSKLMRRGKSCKECCYLKNDITGCLCPNVMGNSFKKCKFTISGRRSYMVVAKPFFYKSLSLMLVMSLRVDSDFAFGARDKGEGITEITNISSSLVIDPLTDIFNRKYLMDNIDFIIKRHIKESTPLSLSCIDIDNFKKFNDNYGHEFGDKVLKRLADEMKAIQNRNEHCIPIRIGGDEFLFIGDGISRKRMQSYMESLCIAVKEAVMKFGEEKVGICVSIGVSGLSENNCYTYKELYEKADENLYRAKERGKNCVVAI